MVIQLPLQDLFISLHKTNTSGHHFFPSSTVTHLLMSRRAVWGKIIFVHDTTLSLERVTCFLDI